LEFMRTGRDAMRGTKRSDSGAIARICNAAVRPFRLAEIPIDYPPLLNTNLHSKRAVRAVDLQQDRSDVEPALRRFTPPCHLTTNCFNRNLRIAIGQYKIALTRSADRSALIDQ
jgi:hypothetical protein